ncbi:hypothetical protein LEAN103870_02940 [Legionella anisa]|uniref:DUF4123 domain-containing protein n=1 Tax=Legionella anisa TaxID=28082 RepID=A0AAX0WTJ9_9GAMM|nr:hypothetical protein [Legionella anisa]AWN74395.1 hypothetical protein DLD14_11340 [Legionella anisa]KTC71923.1 hypothetical protein Lani_1515 [Legionella anisa]MBN5935278.1 hypothetical protein [Legionella anisa]MCW8425506.1 hypothetical protein [Legionella anisa]MCW8449063.1 hypothetical protein [Legionella anisa]
MRVVIDSECSSIPEKAKTLNSEGNVLLNFLLSLGYNPENPPAADLLKEYHNLEGGWLVLTPVHWEATHNDAMIVALGKDLQLEHHESKLWFNLFSQYLAEEGTVLYYHDAGTWLLNNHKNLSVNAKPPYRLLHQSLMPELTQLDKTMHWQKFITESQMLFASQSHQSLANGLWVWGDAKLKDKIPIKICVDEHFYSLAQICSTQVTLYSPAVMLKDYQILLLTEFSMLSEQHQEELKKMTVHWYWNNLAYSTSANSWYARLWRKLIHAY